MRTSSVGRRPAAEIEGRIEVRGMSWVGGTRKRVCEKQRLQDGDAGSNPKASDPVARAEQRAGQLRRGPHDVDRDVKRGAAYGMCLYCRWMNRKANEAHRGDAATGCGCLGRG